MKEYIVSFEREVPPAEEYFYNTLEEAQAHFDLFRNDDSGLYKRIVLLEYNGAELQEVIF